MMRSEIACEQDKREYDANLKGAREQDKREYDANLKGAREQDKREYDAILHVSKNCKTKFYVTRFVINTLYPQVFLKIDSQLLFKRWIVIRSHPLRPHLRPPLRPPLRTQPPLFIIKVHIKRSK
jgi:hypothetical protein